MQISIAGEHYKVRYAKTLEDFSHPVVEGSENVLRQALSILFQHFGKLTLSNFHVLHRNGRLFLMVWDMSDHHGNIASFYEGIISGVRRKLRKSRRCKRKNRQA